MKNILDFKDLAEFVEHFHDEETCRAHFASIRFANGEYCPHCGHRKIYSFKGGKRYRCADCKQDFTIVTGTVFGETKLPLRKWFIAIYLLTTTSKGISSIQLAKHVGVTQKTGWFMDHRLREAIKANKGKLFGEVEVDETYVGGEARNMHKARKKARKITQGNTGKVCVMGMMVRKGQVKARIVKGHKGNNIRKMIHQNVKPGSLLYTDQSPIYDRMAFQGFKREAVNHACKEYVRGEVHTNGIESFWAMFKRGYHGVYHWMSKQHLQRYVDEYAFRWNNRPLELPARFATVVQKVTESERLTYKKLIA